MIEFFPKQQEFMDALSSEQYTFILYGGAMAGGKTFVGLSALLIACQIFPKSRWCVVREDLEKIRTTTIPSFQKLNASGKLKENPYVYTHPNGSVILFKGENYDKDKDLQWLKGLEVNGFLFEEINECQEVTFNLAFSRIGRWECEPRPKPIIIGTCNPSQGWVKSMIYNRWKNNTLPSKWLYIPAKVTDNPYLTEEYKESLKNLPRYQYEVFVNGDWDIQLKTGGEFYKCFELDKHVVETAEYDPTIPLHISWDDNVNPYLPLGIFQIHKRIAKDGIAEGYDVVMIDEIAGQDPRNTIRAVCDEFKRRYPNHNAGLLVYGDATARKEDTKLEKGHDFYKIVADCLKDYKPSFRVLNSNPSVKMRGDFINTVLEKEIFDIRIFINKNCKFAINDFVGTKEAADGTKNKEMETDPKTKVRYQKYGHFTDLFDYFFVSAFAAEFMKYQRGGLNLLLRMGKASTVNNY